MALTATSHGSMATSAIGMAATVGGHGVRRFTTVQPLSYQSIHPVMNHRWSHMIMSKEKCIASLYTKVASTWRKNLARLYARRTLDIAIASAAALATKAKLMTKLDANAVKPIPSAWKDWQQPDWEEAAMASVGKTSVARFWMATRRLIDLSVLASPFLVLMPLSYVTPKAQTFAWDYALWAIEKAGPTYIKLMQWASTRQDLFSPEFCAHFRKLQDETRGHSLRVTKKILQQELGEKGLEALKVSDTPIGSGCIAQVYEGRLLKPSLHYPAGTKVAVKVQHPGIWNRVCVDFYIFRKMANFIEGLPFGNFQYLSIGDTVKQFRDVMLPQMDLTLEANNLTNFNRDFASDDQINFPKPLDELTTDQVLVETFCGGKPVLEYTKDGTPVRERKQLAELGLRMTLQMIFLNDRLHGDLHPGNILVSGTYPTLKYQVLDCGLVLEMGPDQHANLVKVLGAFTRRDGRTAGSLMVDLKSESQATEEGKELFIEGIEQICIMDEDQNFIENVGDYITDICSLACFYQVKLEGAFVNAALAVEIMEGLASALYPQLKVQQVALPMIVKAEMMHRLGWR